MRSAAWAGDWPVTQPWGPTDLQLEPRYEGGWWHCGVDVGMPVGTPLYAVRPGTVTHRTSGILGLRTASGTVDYYVHGHYTVFLGVRVAALAPLGYSGDVIPGGGSLTGPHLHFEVQPIGVQINTPPGHDPLPVLAPGTYGPGGGTVVPDFMAALTDKQQADLYQWTDEIRHSAAIRNPVTPAMLQKAVSDLEAAIIANPPGVYNDADVLAAIAAMRVVVDRIDRGE